MTLELFPKHPDADAYRVGGAYQPYAVVAVDKRFTDAELAAEWQANEIEAWRMVGYRPEFYDVDRAEELEDRSATIRRFTLLPHASDTNYE